MTGDYEGLSFKTSQEVDKESTEGEKGAGDTTVSKESSKEFKEADKHSKEPSKEFKEPGEQFKELVDNVKEMGDDVKEPGKEFFNFKVPGKEVKMRGKELKESGKVKVGEQTPVKAKPMSSSTPRATPRSSLKRKQQENLQKEGESKKPKQTKKPAKAKVEVKKKKMDENIKEDEDDGFKFNESMLNEFINTDVNFTTSTQNDSLSDTMI